MHFDITHLTRYTYDHQVTLQSHLLYLCPRESPILKVNHFSLEITPTAQIHWVRDDFDNLSAHLQFQANASVLEIQSRCGVTTADTSPFAFLLRDYAQKFPFTYEPLHHSNLAIYFIPSPKTDQAVLRVWLAGLALASPQDTVTWLTALNLAINHRIGGLRRDEAGVQSASETIRTGSGSCRDLAVLFIECARLSGLAARFVSGYVYEANRADDSDMHAWVEVFLPGAGWRGLDPSRGIFCDNAYIPVAHAAVAESVNPVQGSFTSGTATTTQATFHVTIRQTDLKAVPLDAEPLLART